MPHHLGMTSEQGPDRTVVHDSFTCSHCQLIVEVPHRASPENVGGLCKMCMKLVCPQCNGLGLCVPWQKQMEQMEARERARRSYGL